MTTHVVAAMESSWVLYMSGRTSWRSTITRTFLSRGGGWGVSGHGWYCWTGCSVWRFCHMMSSRERERSGTVRLREDKWAIFATKTQKDGRKQRCRRNEENRTAERERKQGKENQKEEEREQGHQPYHAWSDRSLFLALQDSKRWSVFTFRFRRWVHSVRLVHDPWCLFQNCPAHLTYLMITMKSGPDRLPRRSGLCVLFHADQLLVISWSPRTRSMTRRWISWSSMNGAKRWWRWSFWIWCQGQSGCAWWCNHRTVVIVDSLSRYNVTIGVIRIEIMWSGTRWDGQRCWVCSTWIHGVSGLGNWLNFLFLFWLWISDRWCPLLGPGWNWNGRTSGLTRISYHRCGTWIGHRDRKSRGSGGENWCALWWRTCWHRTKIWFWIDHHMGRDTSMWCHGWRTSRCW